MLKGEIIKQISDLINAVYANFSDNSDVAEIKEMALQIYNAVFFALYDEECTGSVAQLSEIVNRSNIDVKEFCFQTEKCLVDYCVEKVLKYEDVSYLKQIEGLNDTIKDLNKHLFYLGVTRDAYHKKYMEPSARFSGRGMVYSVITGGYDGIIEPTEKDSSLKYVMLTDRPIDNYEGRWEVTVVDNKMNLTAKQFSRWLKMHPHELFPEFDWSVYVDGNIEVKKNLEDYIKIYAKDSGMLCFPHHNSRSIEEEAEVIISRGLAEKNDLEAQLTRYRQEGFIGDGYIIEAGCIARDHHDNVLKNVMEDWWKEYCLYEHGRDQISFVYACWKNTYKYDICDMIIAKNPWIEVKYLH